MIDSALKLIRDELHAYLLSRHGGLTEVPVVIDNIALSDAEGSLMDDSVVITLVNIEEESAFRSAKTLMKTVITDKVSYEKRPVCLNLYILFCPNFKGGAGAGGKYLASVKILSDIVRFFQVKNYLTVQNSPNSTLFKDNGIGDDMADEFVDFKISMDIYSLSLEQINHVWGSFGGKQLPFVMYKARVVEVTDNQVSKVGSLITGVDTSENVL